MLEEVMGIFKLDDLSHVSDSNVFFPACLGSYYFVISLSEDPVSTLPELIFISFAPPFRPCQSERALPPSHHTNHQIGYINPTSLLVFHFTVMMCQNVSIPPMCEHVKKQKQTDRNGHFARICAVMLHFCCQTCDTEKEICCCIQKYVTTNIC